MEPLSNHSYEQDEDGPVSQLSDTASSVDSSDYETAPSIGTLEYETASSFKDTDFETEVKLSVDWSANEYRTRSAKVYEERLVHDSLLDLSPEFTSERFRLIDCQSLLENQTLVIYETPDIPGQIPYMIMPYIPDCDTEDPLRFSSNMYLSDGRNGGNRINTLGLRKSITFESRNTFLWIPHICIRPGDRLDASWHFARTAKIFNLCAGSSIRVEPDSNPTSQHVSELWLSFQWVEEFSKLLSADVLSDMRPSEMLRKPYEEITRRNNPMNVFHHQHTIYWRSNDRTRSFKDALLLCIVDFFSWGIGRWFSYLEEKGLLPSVCDLREIEIPALPFQVQKAYQVPLSHLKGHLYKLTSIATPCTFRLVDCRALLKEDTLVIYETQQIPSYQYATVSYPWIGVSMQHYTQRSDTFRVFQPGTNKPKLDLEGDPISMEVLKLACIAAVKDRAGFLWVDRLCINQDDATDKRWQIRCMGDVYKECCTCIVIPGGLQRLAGLSEKTPWIHRMWTLQEAILPWQVKVLYEDWSFTYGNLWTEDMSPINSSMASNPHARLSSLEGILEMHYNRQLVCGPPAMFDETYAHRLLCIFREPVRQDQPRHEYRRYFMYWDCAFDRTASRPDDLLLGTMGMFGVSLEEGEARSSCHIHKAFVREFQKNGIDDPRLVGLRDALRMTSSKIGPHIDHWEQIVLDFDRESLSQLNGIAPNSNKELDLALAGPPITTDKHGRQIFLGSAVQSSVTRWEYEYPIHPCRVVVTNSASFDCYSSRAYKETPHDGSWVLRPFDIQRMEWVPTPEGKSVIPIEKEPVEGGYLVNADGPVRIYYGRIIRSDSDGTHTHLGRMVNRVDGRGYIWEGEGTKAARADEVLCWKEPTMSNQWGDKALKARLRGR